MNTDTIWQLYPIPAQEVSLEGLYLQHDLRQFGPRLGRPFVYTNYIVSIDGRIAVPQRDNKGMVVPKDTVNDRDWRMFQELATQSDIIISSGRYLREYGEGKVQEILRIYDEPRFADLGRWRAERGLPAYPDLAIVSNSLNFTIPPFLTQSGRKVTIITHATADKERRRRLEDEGGHIAIAGESIVSGKRAIDALGALGYRTVYMATGPQVHHLLLTDNMVDRLYVTTAHRLLGNRPFSSLVEGGPLEPAVGLHLNALYFDPHALGGLGQQFTCYER